MGYAELLAAHLSIEKGTKISEDCVKVITSMISIEKIEY